MNYEKIGLVSEVYSKDEYGMDVVTETVKNVFAKIDSISSREFFSAGQNNIKPEFKLTVTPTEYGGEKIVTLSGQRYSVYRTYRASENALELYVERKTGTV